jgi:hypothetical protein
LVGKMTTWKNASALLETNCKNITQNALNDFREVLEGKKMRFSFKKKMVRGPHRYDINRLMRPDCSRMLIIHLGFVEHPI